MLIGSSSLERYWLAWVFTQIDQSWLLWIEDSELSWCNSWTFEVYFQTEAASGQSHPFLPDLSATSPNHPRFTPVASSSSAICAYSTPFASVSERSPLPHYSSSATLAFVTCVWTPSATQISSYLRWCRPDVTTCQSYSLKVCNYPQRSRSRASHSNSELASQCVWGLWERLSSYRISLWDAISLRCCQK
jgi:hypothetical protein